MNSRFLQPNKNLFLVALGLGMVSCSKSFRFENIYWNHLGERPLINEPTLSPKQDFRAANENLSFQEQSIGVAKIEGAFVKTIQDSKGELKYVLGSYLPRPSQKLAKEAQALQNLSATVIPALQRAEARFKDYRYEGSPEVILQADGHKAEIVWKLVYFDKKGQAREVKVNKHYQIVSEVQTGSAFQEGTGWAYPEGPKRSDLGNVILKNLADDGSLIADLISVQTESTNPVKEPNHQYFFTPADEKFDQVQVFYYINKSYEFFQDRLQANVPRRVRAVLHVGYPDKTNTAFYYSGQIRFGAGDDVSYSKIPLDPSIVLHEASHSLIDAVARLPFQGEGGSINEGFADFFACVQMKNPNLGEASYKLAPFKRTVANTMKLAERNGGLYHDSAVVSGTLWQIKEKLGEEKSLKFAMKVLNRLAPNSNFEFFGKTLNHVSSNEFEAEDSAAISEILKERGWL